MIAGSPFAVQSCVQSMDSLARSDRVAPNVGFGLVLGRDGISTSFMPLLGLTARWDRVTFDRHEQAVTLSGDDFSYTYRIPRALRRS